MILPLSAELALGKVPYVTAGIIILCLVIHYFQDENRWAINSAARSFCASIHNRYAAEDSLDYLSVDEKNCRRDLPVLYSLPVLSRIRELISEDEVPSANMDDFIAQVDARKRTRRLDRCASNVTPRGYPASGPAICPVSPRSPCPCPEISVLHAER